MLHCIEITGRTCLVWAYVLALFNYKLKMKIKDLIVVKRTFLNCCRNREGNECFIILMLSTLFFNRKIDSLKLKFQFFSYFVYKNNESECNSNYCEIKNKPLTNKLGRPVGGLYKYSMKAAKKAKNRQFVKFQIISPTRVMSPIKGEFSLKRNAII